MTGDEARERIARARQAIDEIDRELVRLLNERAGHALTVGHAKQRLGEPIYQPAREKRVLARVQQCNDGPLADDAVRRLFERIVDEARRLERMHPTTPDDEVSNT